MRAALLSALLISAAGALVGTSLPLPLMVAAVPVLAALAALSVCLQAGRATVALLVAVWATAAVLAGDAHPWLVVVAAVLLRVWAGVPELLDLGRAGVTDLVPDVVGGAAAATLVLLLAQRPQTLPAATVLLVIGGGSALVVVGALRLRR